MPRQVIPLTELDQIGVIKDSPPVSLPPNAFSDVRNVRFKDNAVRKMEGEVNIFPNLFDDGEFSYNGNRLKYVVWWPNPNVIDTNQGYYLLIIEEERMGHPRGDIVDVAYLVAPGDTSLTIEEGVFTRDETSSWQHTFFQGGFALVINNGLDAPHYILDIDGNEDISAIPNFQPLPGWESYNINNTVITDTFRAAVNDRDFAIGTPVDFDEFRIVITVTVDGVDTNTSLFEGTFSSNGISYSDMNNTAVISFSEAALPDNAMVTIRIESLRPILVRAGVIRSFGDFLVAGNLVEYDSMGFESVDTRLVVRNLSGVVRDIRRSCSWSDS